MTSRSNTPYRILMPTALVTLATIALGRSLAPTEPLAERVRKAETVFLGTITNKVTEAGWARAELVVEEPLWHTKRNERVVVTWRTGDALMPMYDPADGHRGIAILDHKHEGRYWLRDDKFENPEKLAEVRKLIKAVHDSP